MSMRNTNRLLLLSALAALTCATTTATAQSGRPTAFTNARIYTVSGETIESGTLVIKNGKIEAVGSDVVVPAGAKIVDATGKTIMPGLVSAWSSAGLSAPTTRSNTPQRGGRSRRFRPSMGRSSGATSNKAATKVVDGMYTRQPIFGKLLEVGITSLALTPPGGGFPGLGAVLNPAGKNRDEIALNDEAFVQIGMQRNAGAKKLLTDMFAKAKKAVEEREKPPEPKEPEKKPEAAKPATDKPTEKPAEKAKDGKVPPTPTPTPTPTPKPTPKPAPKPAPKDGEKKQEPKAAAPANKAPEKKPKDPNVEVIADLLQGKRRAIVQIDSAADLLHWRTAVDDDVKFPRMVVVTRHDSNSGTIDMVTEHLKKWDCSVLLPPSLSTLPRTQHLTHPAKKLHDAGIEIGFAIGDSPTAVRNIFFSLMELVRAGLPADVAIKAITLVPAKALGIDKRTGTIEVGKDADLLLFSGDPLSPVGKLEQVWLRGSRVESKQ
ncbi:MAG: hypothetical protein ACI90M_000140 [Candidatus Azotimanducaceae bacterium]|jgi:hypothetical protein